MIRLERFFSLSLCPSSRIRLNNFQLGLPCSQMLLWLKWFINFVKLFFSYHLKNLCQVSPSRHKQSSYLYLAHHILQPHSLSSILIGRRLPITSPRWLTSHYHPSINWFFICIDCWSSLPYHLVIGASCPVCYTSPFGPIHIQERQSRVLRASPARLACSIRAILTRAFLWKYGKFRTPKFTHAGRGAPGNLVPL